MEDIRKKAHDDEFNKGKEDIGKAPRKFIPVPKVDKKGDKGKKPDKCKKVMDKPAKPKDMFYLFRRERTQGEGYEYIQHLISPSHDDGLSTSCYPEYAWRGQTLLDIKKMKYLISLHRYYKDSDWELVKYEMEVDTPSWSHQPERKEYENLYEANRKWRKLSNAECVKLEEYKQFAINRYGSKG